MRLVVCHYTDEAALWAYRGLSQRLPDVELLIVESLACALRWEHRIGPAGCRVEVTLADGRRVDSRRVTGTLNRTQWVPQDALAVALPEERPYASQEIHAFFLGWLRTLPPPIVNPPTPQGLSGRWRHPGEWHCLAGGAGLPTRPLSLTASEHDLISAHLLHRPESSVGRRTVLVLDGEVFGDPAPPDIAEGCLHLATLAETPLLGVDFRLERESTWIFSGAAAWPDIRAGGSPFLDRLASVLSAAP